MKAYKLFKIKNDKLYPLYVYTDEEIPIGEWLVAKEGQKSSKGKVKSKLGELAFRPGWHCCEFPLADHIGKRQPNGKLYQRKDTIWCEVEVLDKIDYTEQAKQKLPRDSYLKYIPTDGFYWYKTNPSAKTRWLICSNIKIIRTLTNEEVIKICSDNGFTAQPISEI